MLAPEDSQRVEANYQYGSVAPKPEREQPKKNIRVPRRIPTARSNPFSGLRPGERIFVLFMLLVIGLFCMMTVFFHAWASHIKYDVNALNQEAVALSNDIDNLNVRLNSFSDLDELEKKASAEYSMVYPDHTKYIVVEPMKDSNAVNKYISSLTASQRGLAAGSRTSTTAAARHLLSRA